MGIKTKVGLALATSAVGAAMLAGGSFAMFTSSATNSGNTFTSGTVVVTDITSGSVASQAVNFGNLAPGDNGTVQMTVKNDGSLDEWVKIDNALSDASKGGSGLFNAGGLTLSYDTKVVKLAPGGTTTFNIGYNLPLTADNTFQGQTGTFNVVVDAVQDRNNHNADDSAPTAW